MRDANEIRGRDERARCKMQDRCKMTTSGAVPPTQTLTGLVVPPVTGFGGRVMMCCSAHTYKKLGWCYPIPFSCPPPATVPPTE